MALIVATNVSSAIVILPQCKPVARLWNPTLKGTCWRQETQVGIDYYQGGKTAKRHTLPDAPYS